MYVRIENAKIHGNTYYDEGTFLLGGYKNLIVSGGDLNNKICTGKFINVEITDNISWDTWYSITCGPGWATTEKVKLYIVNATIGGNRDRMNLPGTNSTVKGSQVNIYNSIFYDNNSPPIYTSTGQMKQSLRRSTFTIHSSRTVQRALWMTPATPL